MKITCNREKLLHAFQTVAAIAPARSPKPILQNVKLEVTEDAATLMATDLEVGIRYEVAGIEVDAPGAAVLPVGRFGSILRESSDATFRIEVGQRRHARSAASAASSSCPSENPHEFPADRRVRRNELLRALGPAVPRVDPPHDLRHRQRKQPLRPGRREARMARTTCSPPSAPTAAAWPRWKARPKRSASPPPFGDVTVVPTRAMQLLERALAEDGSEVQIAVRQNDILVKSPRATIYSRLVEGRFPRWRDVFPQRANSIKIDLTVGPRLLGRPPGGDRHQRRKPRHRFHVRRRHAGARRPNGRSRPVAHRAADRLRRPADLDHARPALRERFPQSARARKNVHDRPARQRRAPPSAPPTTATAT